MPTLRIPVSDDLHHNLIELKGKMRADDWPALMQCIVNEMRWADFARPVVNTILKWAQTTPVQEPEALKKLGFVIMDDVDGRGTKGIMFPNASLILPISDSIKQQTLAPNPIVNGARCERCGYQYILRGNEPEPCPRCNPPGCIAEIADGPDLFTVPDKCPKCNGHVVSVYHTGDKEDDPTEWVCKACGYGAARSP